MQPRYDLTNAVQTPRNYSHASPSAPSCGCVTHNTGRAQHLLGQISCDACATGKSNPYFKQSECVQCGTGQYIDQPGQIKCLPCNEGLYQSLTGQSVRPRPSSPMRMLLRLRAALLA